MGQLKLAHRLFNNQNLLQAEPNLAPPTLPGGGVQSPGRASALLIFHLCVFIVPGHFGLKIIFFWLLAFYLAFRLLARSGSKCHINF
jgi:hypothetical protein